MATHRTTHHRHASHGKHAHASHVTHKAGGAKAHVSHAGHKTSAKAKVKHTTHLHVGHRAGLRDHARIRLFG